MFLKAAQFIMFPSISRESPERARCMDLTCIHPKGVSLRSVLIVGLVRSLLSMFFLSMYHMIPKDKFLDYICMKQIFTLKTFQPFNHSSTFDKAVFCLGEKQGMLINNECSSRYTKAGNF